MPIDYYTDPTNLATATSGYESHFSDPDVDFTDPEAWGTTPSGESLYGEEWDRMWEGSSYAPVSYTHLTLPTLYSV